MKKCLIILSLAAAFLCFEHREGSISSKIRRVAFVSEDVAFIHTHEMELYKAYSNFATWDKQNTFFGSANVEDFVVIPENSSRLFVATDAGKSYVTETQGGSGGYREVVSVTSYIPHPTRADIGIGLKGSVAQCTALPYYTTDFMKGHVLMEDSVCSISFLRSATNEIMYVSKDTTTLPYSYVFSIAEYDGVWNYRRFAGVYNYAHTIDIGFILLYVSNKGTSSLALSYDFGASFATLETEFDPIEIKDMQPIGLLNGIALTGIPAASLSWGTLYAIDSRGKYVLHRLDNVLIEEGLFAAETIDGLDGVVAVNVIDNLDNVAEHDKHPMIRTFISFDAGNQFDTITCPTGECAGLSNCSLHFNVRKKASLMHLPPLFASQKSIGVLLAAGNCGYHLEEDMRRRDTFISRDGGHNWQLVQTGFSHYTIGNYGGLIALLSENGTDIIYTTDQFATSHLVIQTAVSFWIHGMTSFSAGTSLKMVGYGHRLDGGGSGYVGLNFEGDFGSACTTSDYETFIPSGKSGNCLMGKKTSFNRLKNSTTCLVQNATYVKSVEVCPCVLDDFECDYGFIPSDTHGQCTAISSEYVTGFLEACLPGTSVMWITGYIKLPGDSCSGGLESTYQASLRQCGLGSDVVLIVVVVLGVLYTVLNVLVFSVILLYLVKKTEKGKLITRMALLKMKGYLRSRKMADEETTLILGDEMVNPGPDK